MSFGGCCTGYEPELLPPQYEPEPPCVYIPEYGISQYDTLLFREGSKEMRLDEPAGVDEYDAWLYDYAELGTHLPVVPCAELVEAALQLYAERACAAPDALAEDGLQLMLYASYLAEYGLDLLPEHWEPGTAREVAERLGRCVAQLRQLMRYQPPRRRFVPRMASCAVPRLRLV